MYILGEGGVTVFVEGVGARLQTNLHMWSIKRQGVNKSRHTSNKVIYCVVYHLYGVPELGTCLPLVEMSLRQEDHTGHRASGGRTIASIDADTAVCHYVGCEAQLVEGHQQRSVVLDRLAHGDGAGGRR